MAFKLLSNAIMSNAILLLSAPIVGLLVFVLIRYYRLRHIPGPLLPAFTDLWIQSKVWRGYDLCEIVPELHRIYGPVVRWGPNRVSFASPAAIEKIHNTKDVFPKAPSYQPLAVLAEGREVTTFISLRDEKRVSTLKSQVLAGFSQNTWLKQEDQIDETINLLVQCLHEIGRGGHADVQLDHWILLWNFDTFSQLAFSKSRDYLRAGVDVDGVFSGSLTRLTHWTHWKLLPTLEAWLYKGWLSRFAKRTSSVLVPLALARIEQRKRDGNDGEAEAGSRDLIGRFLAASQQNPQVMSPDDVLSLTLSTISAGADTTSTTLSQIFANLVTHPEVYAKLEKEIEGAGLSFPPRFKDVASLPYLDAVVHESMRHSPLGASQSSERIATHDTIICDFFIPKGTDVSISTLDSANDPTVFGADVNRFRPERWLGTTDRQHREMATASMSFSEGRRVCIGRHLARIEMKKLIAALIMAFKLKPVCEPVRFWEQGLCKVDLKVRLEPRN